MAVKPRWAGVSTRLPLLIAAAVGIGWSCQSFSSLRTENSVAGIRAGIRAGEVYKSETLAFAEQRIQADSDFASTASGRTILCLIRLRLFEHELASGSSTNIDRAAEQLDIAVNDALSAAPMDSFLWLIRFWVANTRLGLSEGNMSFLRASYDLGPHEGWIAVRRARLALSIYFALPPDLAGQAVDEFIDLVRWGLASEAVEIAVRLDRPLRLRLFERLGTVNIDQRRSFASLWYRRDVDDLLIPGVQPPPAPTYLPVVPPGY